VSELRLDLASSGLPQGGVVGFEIFDNKNFGVTDFVQKLNYQRALQGELARTISNLDEVQACRVHIVMPKKSLFIEHAAEPSVSVFLKLKTGRKLAMAQIDGIVHLVASGIEELRPDNVVVVDSSGRVLSKNEPESQIAKRTTSQIEYQRNVEAELAQRIKSMLAKVVGGDKVMARVSAAFDFRVTEKTEELFDSEEPAVRSRHSATEKSKSPYAGGGQSTVAPITGIDKTVYNTDHQRTDETVNYEINRVVSKTVMPTGVITKLSVAVLVDGTYVKNEKGGEVFQPRSKREMAALEELVKKSVGFDARRGDQVVVSSVPFKKNEQADTTVAEEHSWKRELSVYLPIIKYVLSMLAILLIVMFVLRPMVKSLTERGKEQAIRVSEVVSPGQHLERGAASYSLEGPQTGVSQEIQVVKQLADADDKGFAELLRNWVK